MLDVSSQLPVNNTYNNTSSNTATSENNAVTPQRDDTFSQIGGIVGGMAAGGAASYKFSANFSSSLKSTIEATKAVDGGFGDKVKATMPGVKAMGLTTLKAGGIGALISGAASAISNGIDVLRGKKTGADAIGTFAADTVNGSVGAMAGVAAGGLATFALSSFATLGATPLMIIGVGVGAGIAALSNKLFQSSGAYDAIRNGVMATTSQK